MMGTFVLTPPRGSHSGVALARAMGAVRLAGKKLNAFKGSKNDFIVNWGNSDPPQNVMECTVINQPQAIRTAVNKLSAFKAMAESRVSIPVFTDDAAHARSWIARGETVVARTVLNGSGGEGIHILTKDSEWVDAPLYTVYKKKKAEYRFHVIGKNVFDVQTKMRRRDCPDDQVNWMVRNHDNGFVFGRGAPLPDFVYEEGSHQAVRAVKSLGLDFGAVDIIYNANDNSTYVLEVNTAPGLEGQTVTNYRFALGRFMEQLMIKNMNEPNKKRLLPNFEMPNAVKKNNLVDFLEELKRVNIDQL